MPLLINIHAAVTLITDELAKCGLLTWKAAGEIDEDDMCRNNSTSTLVAAPTSKSSDYYIDTGIIPNLVI